jgi:cytochrome bd-type quinol oxidase subunit 1
MTLGLVALIFIVVVTVGLIIVTNKKISKKVRIAVGIIGSLIALVSAVYILLTLLLIASVR